MSFLRSLLKWAIYKQKWPFGGHFENLRNSYYIDRVQMLRDNALKFDRDHASTIPNKPIQNWLYMSKLLGAILKILVTLM